MGLLKFFQKKHHNKIRKNAYTCKWCDYLVYPGEYHEACELLIRKHTCQVCSYPQKPGRIHDLCKKYLQFQFNSYPYCLYCKRVCIPDKPHRDCNFLAMYNSAPICRCCGFKVLKGLEHKYCQKFTILE
jgi:hypothetical protein